MSAIEVILVDKNDIPTGKMEKLEVHEKGLLHRAVTVYVFNRKGEFLLQRRAASKYHCGGLWSNTCCGHPFPGEGTQQAAERRLREEMGLSISLQPVFEISYNMPLNNGLTEHEYGHVFSASPTNRRYSILRKPMRGDIAMWVNYNVKWPPIPTGLLLVSLYAVTGYCPSSRFYSSGVAPCYSAKGGSGPEDNGIAHQHQAAHPPDSQ